MLTARRIDVEVALSGNEGTHRSIVTMEIGVDHRSTFSVQFDAREVAYEVGAVQVSARSCQMSFIRLPKPAVLSLAAASLVFDH